MVIAQHKGEISAGATAAGAVVSWLDIFQGFLEWGVLIAAFISGGFAVYWNVLRCVERYKEKKNGRPRN